MIRLLCCILLAISLTSAVFAGDLNAEIRAALSDKLLAKAEVGVRIVRLGDVPSETRLVYEHNATTPLIPASNLKLITTAAALDTLGPDFRFRTALYSKGQDLAIVGDGDPALGDDEMLRKVGWDTLTVFNLFAKQLQERKMTAANNLLVDDSIFEQIFQHPNWPQKQDDRRYMAGVAGLNLNTNCIDLTVESNGYGRTVSYTLNPPTKYVNIRNGCKHGNDNAIVLSRTVGTNDILLAGETRGSTNVPVTVNIEDPAMFAGTVLMETLTSSGVHFSGTAQRDRTIRQQLAHPNANGWTVIAAHETALPTALARANKDSQNVYAEALCKRLGAASNATGDWKNGPAAMAAFMKRIGVADNQFSFDDGCGLSKQNAITATALTQVLTYNYHTKNRQAFFSSLAVAGVDGTLEDRFRGSDLRGRVFGKSGFVEGVSALSGYFRGKDGHWYAFSILMNGIPRQSNGQIKPVQEKIIAAVDRSLSTDVAGR
jgi:D-alanyl-D-alanine carboxypeptidase/D-alanyl-D-alanine-endopeptidase (penicillin-binding protein 4)